MKMKMAAVLLAAVTILGLSACGGATKSGEPAKDTAKTVSQVRETTEGGETVNVGDFTVTVPEGWLGLTDADIYEEEADGKYPAAADTYTLVEGAKSKTDILFMPTAYIKYFADKNAGEKFESNTGLFEDTSAGEITIGGKTYQCYSGETDIAQEGEEPEYYRRTIIYVPASANSCFRIFFESFSKMDGEIKFDVADSDVASFIDSLKENAG